MVDLSIAIVNINTRKLLEDCLQSIFNQTRQASLGVFVVDNGSTDGSVEMVREKFPAVHVIENSTNVGFTRANNQALRQSSGRYLMILNPDTVVLDGALDKMVDFMDAHSEAGVLGCVLLDGQGNPQPIQRYPTLAITAGVLFRPVEVIRRRLDHYEEEMRDGVRLCRKTYPIGACLMTRRDVVERVGLLDENIFCYAEDTDWCRRIAQAGWKVYELAHVHILHYGGQGAEHLKESKKYNWCRSNIYYYQKHRSFLAQVSLRGVILARIVWEMVSEQSRLIMGDQTARRKIRLCQRIAALSLRGVK